MDAAENEADRMRLTGPCGQRALSPWGTGRVARERSPVQQGALGGGLGPWEHLGPVRGCIVSPTPIHMLKS